MRSCIASFISVSFMLENAKVQKRQVFIAIGFLESCAPGWPNTHPAVCYDCRHVPPHQADALLLI